MGCVEEEEEWGDWDEEEEGNGIGGGKEACKGIKVFRGGKVVFCVVLMAFDVMKDGVVIHVIVDVGNDFTVGFA